jgi:uncharacterized protein YeaO (DUF488 family)
MHTSNFSKSALDPNAVSIALWNPKWYKGKSYRRLAPSEALLRAYGRDHDVDRYVKIYTEEILTPLDPRQVYEDLGPDAVILCHCAATVFCHRFVVARWLDRHLNLHITEIPNRYKVGAPHG